MNARARLFESSAGLVERVACAASRRPGGEDFSPDFQIAFPYRGIFLWHVGGEAVAGDPNQVLFIRGGEPFRVSAPRPGGYAEVIVTPVPAVLRDISETAGFELERHPLFRARSRRASPTLQFQCARFVHRRSTDDARDALAADEELIGLLQDALRANEVPPTPSERTRRLIRRAKEFLDAHVTRRARLTEVASAVDASPAYLTDVFRRFEGVSLQRYLTQLRLARSLIELPHASDLTALALDLGFSSHSHFTLAFRRAFNCTPSYFRVCHSARRDRIGSTAAARLAASVARSPARASTVTVPATMAGLSG